MKKIYYEEGPQKLMILNVGIFEKNIPKEVGDEYADSLVKKGTFKYFVEVQPTKRSATTINKTQQLNIEEV